MQARRKSSTSSSWGKPNSVPPPPERSVLVVAVIVTEVTAGLAFSCVGDDFGRVLRHGAQPTEAAGQQPGHVHLAHAHPGGDLRLAQLVPEAQADDDTLAFGEAFDERRHRVTVLQALEV